MIGHYGRDLGLFSVETAVYKMTGLTARQFRLKDRGFIRVGCKADVTIFDPATIRDVADWSHPHEMSVGIMCVFVNGTEDADRVDDVLELIQFTDVPESEIPSSS